jgi:hypothetical protein
VRSSNSIETQEAEIRAMNARHTQLSFEGLRLIMQRICGDDAAGIQGLDASKLSARDVAALVPVLVKTERLSRGAESERIEQRQNTKVELVFSFDPSPTFGPGMEESARGMIDDEPRELPPA